MVAYANGVAEHLTPKQVSYQLINVVLPSPTSPTTWGRNITYPMPAKATTVYEKMLLCTDHSSASMIFFLRGGGEAPFKHRKKLGGVLTDALASCV